MKNFIITGAGTGIGQALALNLAGKGHRILAVGRRLSHLSNTQTPHPKQIDTLAGDITEDSFRQAIADWAACNPGALYLVHNAGIAEPLGLLKDIGAEAFRYQLAVNVEAPLFLTQRLLPYLAKGRILHISSGLAHFHCPGAASYCISKAALYMLYQSWREELIDQDIAVGLMSPGAVDTPMQEMLRSTDRNTLPIVDSFIRFKKSGDLISPAIVADFISWLLLATTTEDFSHAEWDIADASHHKHWLQRSDINWDVRL